MQFILMDLRSKKTAFGQPGCSFSRKHVFFAFTPAPLQASPYQTSKNSRPFGNTWQ
jgi:hypothetical protein